LAEYGSSKVYGDLNVSRLITAENIKVQDNLVFHDGRKPTPADVGSPPTSTTISAGDGLTGGGTLADNRTLTLGTPSTIDNATTNSLTASSHTHALTLPTTATRWPAWTEVTSKPSTFPPDTHSHTQLHTHSNKTTLDKISEDAGDLLFNGEAISGSIEKSFHVGTTPPENKNLLWFDTN